jgi:hypothetical protein
MQESFHLHDRGPGAVQYGLFVPTQASCENDDDASFRLIGFFVRREDPINRSDKDLMCDDGFSAQLQEAEHSEAGRGVNCLLPPNLFWVDVWN